MIRFDNGKLTEQSHTSGRLVFGFVSSQQCAPASGHSLELGQLLLTSRGFDGTWREPPLSRPELASAQLEEPPSSDLELEPVLICE